MKKIFKAKILGIIILIEIILVLASLIATPIILNLYTEKLSALINVKNLTFVVSGCIYFLAIPFILCLIQMKSISKLLSIEGYSCRKVGNKFTFISIFSIAEFVFTILVQIFLWKQYKIFFYEWSIAISVLVLLLTVTFALLTGVLASAFRNMEPKPEKSDDTGDGMMF